MTMVELCVHMDCSGCETKIRKALKKLDGVNEVDVDMARQKVTVMGWADQRKVLKAVRKTGRRAVLWPYGPGHSMNLYSQTVPEQAVTGYYTQYRQHPALGPAPTSSYNYYVHGYDDATHHGYACGYDYQMPPGLYGGGGYSVVDDGAPSVFSDDNPHACAIM